MDLFRRIEQQLLPLRPVFHREITFQWFFLLVHGMLLRTRFQGVSSCIEALGLGAAAYHQALHFFRSTAFSTRALMKAWHDALLQHPDVLTFGGRPVYVGDGIKIPKEGRRMPGVKRLHQESDNNSKPEWIRGHYFGALGLLLKKDRACFHLPIYTQLQDGLDGTGQPDDTDSLVAKMGRLARFFLPPGAYLILDAYYAAMDLLTELTAAHIDLITRVKLSTVAYRALPPSPEKRGRGRPPTWGARIKLAELFEETAAFQSRRMWLYQAFQRVRWRVVDLYWHSPTTPVRFVLAELGNGKRLILLSTDCTLGGLTILWAYTLRFKIEAGFSMLVGLLSGFDYQFWSKAMARQPRWRGNLDLSGATAAMRTAVLSKVESFERYINLQGIVLGLLQLLSLEASPTVLAAFPGWFRTRPAHGLASESMVRMTLQHQATAIFAGSSPHRLLWKFLEARTWVSKPTVTQNSVGVG